MSAIAWNELARDAANARVAKRVIESWNYRSKQEHLAAGGFAMLAHELADVGCEPAVLSLVTRASNDEVRHAETCARMWSALRGQRFAAARFQGTPSLPKYADVSAPLRVLLHAIEMCCLSETFTSVVFTEMLARTTHRVARAVVQSLLTDEIDHGRVGWAHVADHVARNGPDDVEPHLPAMFSRTVRAGLKPAEINDANDDPSLEQWDLAPRTIASIYRRTLAEVIVPGFAHFGIDTAEAMRALKRESWFEPG